MNYSFLINLQFNLSTILKKRIIISHVLSCEFHDTQPAITCSKLTIETLEVNNRSFVTEYIQGTISIFFTFEIFFSFFT